MKRKSDKVRDVNEVVHSRSVRPPLAKDYNIESIGQWCSHHNTTIDAHDVQ